MRARPTCCSPARRPWGPSSGRRTTPSVRCCCSSCARASRTASRSAASAAARRSPPCSSGPWAVPRCRTSRDLPMIAGVAMGIGAMCVVMLKLPLTSVLLATLILAPTGSRHAARHRRGRRGARRVRPVRPSSGSGFRSDGDGRQRTTGTARRSSKLDDARLNAGPPSPGSSRLTKRRARQDPRSRHDRRRVRVAGATLR